MKGITTTLLLIFLSVHCVFAQKQMSDRDIEGLKGNVKTVAEEKSGMVYVNGKWREDEKVTSTFIEYDKEGNLIKRDFYHNGKLSTRNNFGYLDKERIVKETKFPDNGAVFSAPPSPKSKDEEKQRDERYTFKFEYKYDNKGRRVEEVWYSNTGSLWIRDVRKYDDKDNEIEWYRYSSDGKLNMRSFSEFDEKGNPIKTSYPSQIRVVKDAVYSYEYNFDSHGNWIKRITQKLVTSSGKSEFQPFQVHYRKITYFNQK